MGWDTHSIISAAAGAISLVVGLLMWFFAPKADHNSVWHDPLVLVLVFAGGAGLKNSTVGGWVSWCVTHVASWIGSLAITIGIGIGLGIIAFAMVYIVVQQVREQGVLPWMLAVVFLVPFVVGSIPGWIGVAITTVLGYIAAGPAFLIAAGFGIN